MGFKERREARIDQRNNNIQVLRKLGRMDASGRLSTDKLKTLRPDELSYLHSVQREENKFDKRTGLKVGLTAFALTAADAFVVWKTGISPLWFLTTGLPAVASFVGGGEYFQAALPVNIDNPKATNYYGGDRDEQIRREFLRRMNPHRSAGSRTVL